MEEWIKKSDAIEAIKSLVIIHTESRYLNDLEYGHNEGLAHAIDRIEDIPSADRPQGEWIEQEDDYHHYWECSECGMGVGLDDVRNFCPNCGCRMKGADDE